MIVIWGVSVVIIRFHLFSYCRKKYRNDMSCANLSHIGWIVWEIYTLNLLGRETTAPLENFQTTCVHHYCDSLYQITVLCLNLRLSYVNLLVRSTNLFSLFCLGTCVPSFIKLFQFLLKLSLAQTNGKTDSLFEQLYANKLINKLERCSVNPLYISVYNEALMKIGQDQILVYKAFYLTRYCHDT